MSKTNIATNHRKAISLALGIKPMLSDETWMKNLVGSTEKTFKRPRSSAQSKRKRPSQPRLNRRRQTTNPKPINAETLLELI
jgi:hypothetical protein